MTGQSGSIAQGQDLDYLYQQEPDNYVDVISAGAGTIIFESQDNSGRAVSYTGPAGNYRAIHSAFIFGGLRDGADTKQGLMAAYLDFLKGG